MADKSTVRMTRAQDKDVATANVQQDQVALWEKQGWVADKVASIPKVDK